VLVFSLVFLPEGEFIKQQTYTTQIKKRSAINIQQHHSVCETNYYRLLKLMPHHKDGQTVWQIGIIKKTLSPKATEGPKYDILTHSKLAVGITVIDQAPYTTTVELEQASFMPLIKKPKIRVRLYHDASMAEIVSWDRHRNWHPQYLYPNKNMYHPDEKLGLNQFLGEWLRFYCQHGYFMNNRCDGVLVKG